MFNYNLYGQEDSLALQHEKEFTQEEFETMCKEAPIFEYGHVRAYDSFKIIEYLKEKHGFSELEYTAGFCIDNEV